MDDDWLDDEEPSRPSWWARRRRWRRLTPEEWAGINRARHPPERTLPMVEVPGTGVTDLGHLLLEELMACHPALRRDAHWVLSPWWLAQVERLGPGEGLRNPEVAPTIWGIPALVVDHGGWPHLEPGDRLER